MFVSFLADRNDKVCLQVELGSTSACFFSCRPCGYDICPVCAENQAQELAQCGQPFAAPPREHEAKQSVSWKGGCVNLS